MILDDSEVVRAGFPNTKSGSITSDHKKGNDSNSKFGMKFQTDNWNGNEGSAARFFYCAKSSKRDRNEGCEDFFWHKINQNDRWHRVPEKTYQQMDDENKAVRKNNQSPVHIIGKGNIHETVKSTELMRYLCRLITPKNGTVLDPFMGSGSTGKAAVLEGFDFIGIEQGAEYFKIAEARINFILNKKEKQVRLAI